jgi:hypothetical protein
MILTSSDITEFSINFNFKMITVIKEKSPSSHKLKTPRMWAYVIERVNLF